MACSAAWSRARWPRSGAATPHRSPAPSHGRERAGATDPACPGPCCPHHKTLSYLTLQVHGLDAAPAPGHCPASIRLQRGSCSRKLLLIVSSDAVLPGQGNRQSLNYPAFPSSFSPNPRPPSPWVGWRLLQLPLCHAALSLQDTGVLLFGGNQWLPLPEGCLP